MKRGTFAIEHIMPNKWQDHWPLNGVSEGEREFQLQTLGNLTLLTKKLNSSLANGSWSSKSLELTKYDVLLLNKEVQELGKEGWNESRIKSRTQTLIERIILIWPVPLGYRSNLIHEEPEPEVKVNVIDLISAGLVSVGQSIYPRRPKDVGHVAQILEDGRIKIDETVFNSLSLAAIHVTHRTTNGWWYWLSDEKSRASMADLRQEYRELIGLEEGEDEIDDGDDVYEE